jgi:hypothetical protein
MPLSFNSRLWLHLPEVHPVAEEGEDHPPVLDE